MTETTEKEGEHAVVIPAPAGKKKGGVLFKVLVISLLAVIVLLLSLRGCAAKKQDGALEREFTAELGLMPGMSQEEIQDRLNRKVAESMLNVSINPVPVFPDGKSPGNLRIENIPGNQYAFVVEIVRSDTQETILKTGVIDPGYYVEEMKLDTELPKGKYLCVARFIAYDTENLTEIGEAGTQLMITVKA